MITTARSVPVSRNVAVRGAGKRPLPRIVTTSWDDGDPLDFKVAEMLHARKLPATFYVPITGHHGARALDRNELRTLSKEGFEIGGHGFSHLILPQCSRKVVMQEVEVCKHSLEDILGKEVRMFAYPRGRHSSVAVQSVRRAGYAGARTTEMFSLDLHYDPYKMPTTIHVFRHSKSEYIRNMARAVDLGKAWKYLRRLWHVESWVELSKILFDSTMQEGGVFHLYGHSWEIEELGLWNDLEEILDYICNRKDVLYLPNGSALEYRTGRRYLPAKNHCALEG
ncbi:MAG TPA: polysaccharide deacetylase family protein [Terriglobia bacterium]|nr:polysaccharide deacetylase family protein [Terriglobia bacterium]